MTAPKSKLCWFCPSPTWLVIGLLAAEGLLWLSERFEWFSFNQHKGWTVLIAVAAVGVVFVAMLSWLAVSLLFRWRFQFSIRSLLTLTVAIAVPCSWFAVEMKKAREQMAAVDELRKLGANVTYDWAFNASGTFLPNAQPPGPAWLRKSLGDDFFGAVVLLDGNKEVAGGGLALLAGLHQLRFLNLTNTEVTDDGLAHIAGLTRLRLLYLTGTQITDAGLAHIGGLTQLQWLWLDNTQVTDVGLTHLAGLTQLHLLWLGNTQVTDVGLAQLAGLTQLQELDLRNNRITDSGLAHIAGLTQLQVLRLDSTQITDEGVKRLQQALPNSTIRHRHD